MEDLNLSLKKIGFNVKKERLSALKNENFDQIIKKLVNEDIHDFQISSIPSYLLSSGRCIIPGPILLQIESVVDVTQPLTSEQYSKGSDFRLLLFELSDGSNRIKAIEERPIPFISSKIPVGTKLLLKSVRFSGTFLYLLPDNVKVLGGSSPRTYVNLLADI